MRHNPIWAVMFKNAVAIVCFTLLAIIFNKWWLIFLSALFLTDFEN